MEKKFSHGPWQYTPPPSREASWRSISVQPAMWPEKISDQRRVKYLVIDTPMNVPPACTSPSPPRTAAHYPAAIHPGYARPRRPIVHQWAELEVEGRTNGTEDSTALVSPGNTEQRLDPQSRRKRELESCWTDDFVHLKRADVEWKQVAGDWTKRDVLGCQAVSWTFNKVLFRLESMINAVLRHPCNHSDFTPGQKYRW